MPAFLDDVVVPGRGEEACDIELVELLHEFLEKKKGGGGGSRSDKSEQANRDCNRVMVRDICRLCNKKQECE